MKTFLIEDYVNWTEFLSQMQIPIFVNNKFQNGKDQLAILRQVRDWCSEYNVMFKLNSVINRFNLDEDMTAQVTEINPIRSAI